MDFDTFYEEGMNEDFDWQDGGDVDDSALLNEPHGSGINFMGRGIDDLYDPHINHANNDFIRHAQDYLDAETSYQVQTAIDRMQEDVHSVEYWDDCKRQAKINAEKDRIVIDGINAQLEIVEKYRKH